MNPKFKKRAEGCGKLLEVSLDAIVAMDSSGSIVLWNRAAERMFGYDSTEAYGMTVRELMPEAYRGKHIDGVRRFLETGVPVLVGKTVEVEGLRKDGVVFPVELSLSAEKAEGEWTFVSVIRDITERKRAEAEILRQNSMLNKANSELKALFEVSRAISHTIDLEDLLENILKTVLRLEVFNVDQRGGIFLVEGGRMHLKAHFGHTQDFVDLHRGMRVGDCLCGLAAKTGEIIISRNSGEDERHTIDSDLDPHGHIILPLRSDEVTVGVLYLYLPVGAQIDELHRSMLVAIGNMLGVAINNSVLFERTKALALEDPLTGLANKRLMYMELERNVSRSKRYGTPFSAIMIDIDHFKAYNDAKGHLAGDKLLEEFSALLQKATRDMDLRIRYGGEEFLVLLPETDLQTAQAVAERIRKAVEQRGEITVSLGVSTYNNETRHGAEIVNKADAALYLAKRNGRNRVETIV